MPLKKDDWKNYDEQAKNWGTIFNSMRWMNIFGDKIKKFGIYTDKNELIGGFHLSIEKIFGLTVCRNAPLTPHCGPFLKITSKNPVAIMDSWKKAISLMVSYIESMRLPFISIALDKRIIDTQPFLWKKYKVIPGYTYLIDLEQPIETILKRMSPERRNDIKKGERDGFRVEKEFNYNTVHSLVLKSFARRNISINTENIESVLFRFADSSNSFAFVTKNEHGPLAATFCIHDKTTAYYLLGGYAHESRNRSAGPLACLEAIKYAQQLGLQTFDFEGSMEPSIEGYFRGFGGTLTPYYRINKAFIPIEMALKFIKRELF